MSRIRFGTLVSLLLVFATFEVQAQAPTDSVAADSVEPKKKSRFGGLMNKARQVAGNKAVQNMAKGAAANVACTVVPGAAVVSAATGTGPCANAGLLAAVKNGGASSIAATVASNAAGGAAAKAAGKLSGTKGAAAAGALNAAGGKGGISGAAMAAATGAMKSKVGGGMPSAGAMAAAQAAAMKGTGGKSVAGMASAAGMPNGAAMAEAMAAMGALGAAAGAGSSVPTVDFRDLKALMPESLRGMARSEVTGQKTSAMGMTISGAEARYTSADGKAVTIAIADMGSLSGMAGMATYAWASTEIDSERDNGYEKTTKFKGHKALEKYSKQSQSGELTVLVSGRFVVATNGSNVDMDALKSALGAVDLGKLGRLKPR